MGLAERPGPRGRRGRHGSRGIAVGVVTADCGPVLFADADARVVGAAHAGWRGALGGISRSASARWRGSAPREAHRRGARPDDLAGQLRSRRRSDGGLHRADPTTTASSSRASAPATPCSTFPAISSHGCWRPGLLAADLGLCTYADAERFFSYRRATHLSETDYGRLLAAIAIVEWSVLAFKPCPPRRRVDRSWPCISSARSSRRGSRGHWPPSPTAPRRHVLFAQESMYWLTGYNSFGFCFFQCLVLRADGR